MRVLINVPNLNRPGGVATLFSILKLEKHLKNVSLFSINSNIPTLLRIPLKYVIFTIKLINIDIVHLNPSLTKKSFLRDAGFALLTTFFSKKLIVYWHGWDESYENKVCNNKILKWVASISFLKADTSIVLGTIFENKLRELGFKNEIIIETNTAENKFIVNHQVKQIDANNPIRLLFLSRIETAKGIYIAIETLKLLNQSTKRFQLVIAGSGSEEEKIKRIIEETNNIEWIGYVSGEDKHKLLTDSHIMFFPTFYPEGLPLTLLEAMIYGLPIVTRPVGGIPDLIKNNENGYLIESLDPNDFKIAIENITNSSELYNIFSNKSIEKSKIFTPQAVRNRLFSIYETTYNKL